MAAYRRLAGSKSDVERQVDSRDKTGGFTGAYAVNPVDGRITLTFRLWSRPQVKVGGRYAIGEKHFEVDDMELVPFSSVTAKDVKRCGENPVSALFDLLGDLARGIQIHIRRNNKRAFFGQAMANR